MKFIAIFLLCLSSYVNANYDDFPVPVYEEPIENNCKIFVSDDLRLWVLHGGHLYQIKQIIHSYACPCSDQWD